MGPLTPGLSGVTPRPPSSGSWFWAVAVVWLIAVGSGLSAVWAYENQPGVAASAPPVWPRASALAPATDRPTLLFVAHPQCTCTRASLDQFAEVLAETPKPPKTYILFLRPSTVGASWDQTELWQMANRLPNVTVLRDADGSEARRFGVETSGQTLLYDRNGELIFSGGVTSGRGHRGENEGETALISLITRGNADRRATNVFGCPLFAPPDGTGRRN